MEKNEKKVSLGALESERKKWKGRLKEMEEKYEAERAAVIEQGGRIADEDGGETSGKADYLAELAKLVQNPFYADCGLKIDEMREYADRHGVGLKEAYNALYAEEKYEEVRRQAENEMQVAVQARQNRKVDAVNGVGGMPKARAKLSKEQLKMAEMCGMTAAEYLKYS